MMEIRRVRWIAFVLAVIAVVSLCTLVGLKSLCSSLDTAVTGPSSDSRTSSHKPDEAADEGVVEVEQSEPPTTEHTWRWLWEVDSPDLQSWQAFGNIGGAVMSKWGDLIVSDPSNSHVVRLTTDGELVEIIGREGAGPGEFNTPGAVGIETGKDILWVADWTLRRINRYRLLEQTSEFLNSFPIPVGLMLHPQLMTINDSHSYWAVGVAIGSRIAHIDDTGKIHKVFGDFFSSTRYSGSMRHFSEGVVTLTPTGDVLFIGCYQPVIERWTATGELLATTEFPFPETERTKRRERSMPEDRLTYYQLGVAWDETRSHIFLRMNDITTYSVLPESTGVIHRHVVTDVTEAERREWGFPGPFVVSDKGGSIRFFFFDRNGGVRATRPKEP